jgi:hypothetical protein
MKSQVSRCSNQNYGKDGDRLVILLDGGIKKRRVADIMAAKVYWPDYKRRKRQEVS